MPLNSYDGLVSAIKALAEDDSLEFAAYIPTAIYLAEERLIKELDTEGLKSVVSAVATPNSMFLTKPSGTRFVHNVTFRTSAGVFTPDKRGADYIKDYWPVNVSVSGYPNGTPKYYGDLDGTSFLQAPIPASAYNYTFVVTKQFSHLSDSVQTNYFTESTFDSLFYATMDCMSEFMKDPQMVTLWKDKYTELATVQNNEGRRARRDDGMVPNNPKIEKNTLKQEN